MIERMLPLVGVVNHFSQERYRRLSAQVLRRAGVTVEGLPLWVSPRTYFDISGPGSIVLGDRCAISHYVRILTHDFSLDRVAERKLGPSNRELFKTLPVRIGAQAFIGMNVLIMPGVTIGDGAVIGSGSVVTKDVPPDTVWAGNPARQLTTTDEYWERAQASFTWQDRRR